METTAHYRAVAQDHESRCEWGSAADAWQKAIDLYPPRSALGKRDVAQMEDRKRACLHSYFPA